MSIEVKEMVVENQKINGAERGRQHMNDDDMVEGEYFSVDNSLHTINFLETLGPTDGIARLSFHF